VGLRSLDDRNARRKLLAQKYADTLRTRVPPECTLPDPAGNESGSVFHQFVLQTAGRDALREFLARAQIGTGVHYPLALHQQPAFGAFAGGRRFPEAGALASRVLSLPLYPALREEDCERVCSEIIRFWNTQ
jgi:dTDP-4-amino-4,6-dideoxygalactose transaminase